MNIENNKISGRQLGRLVFHDFFALTTLALPGMLTRKVGVDGFFALAAGGVAGFVFLVLVILQIRQMRRAQMDYVAYLRANFGSLFTGLFLLVYFLSALFGAAYALRLLCDIARQYMIRDTPAWLVMAVLALLAVYGLAKGLESRGRMYEIMFWFVLLPLLFLFFLAACNVETQRWLPVFQAEGLQVAKSSYLVFAFLMGSAFLPVLSDDISEHADVSRVLKQSFVLGIGVNLVLFLLLVGIFGAPTVATMEEAALTLTALVKLPGGFLERQDALLCGIWLIGIFAFAENALYYMVWCMKKMSAKSLQGCCLPCAGVLVYLLAVYMYRSAYVTSQLARVYMCVVVPVFVGIVLVTDMQSAWKTKRQPKKNEACKGEKR